MTKENEKKKEHTKRNCLFCQFAEEIDDTSKEVAKRRIEFKGENKWDDVCFAIFDRSPRTLGNALVIAKSPFNDFTDEIEGKDSEKLKVFEAATWTANRIKKVLKAEKVYLMSICDHWEIWETSDGTTTEHLHFHLVPRYKGMRTKEQAGERLLCRKGKEWKKEDLEKFVTWFNNQQ